MSKSAPSTDSYAGKNPRCAQGCPEGMRCDYDECPGRAARSHIEPWMPTPEQPMFNEDALRDEIHKVWGEHGAHAEVYRMLCAEAFTPRSAIEPKS